jgi:hypothetical protein
MNLVDYKNDVAVASDFLNKTLHAAFKLTAKLRTRYKRG